MQRIEHNVSTGVTTNVDLTPDEESGALARAAAADAAWQAARPDRIRDEAARRILARYPIWRQMNMTARGVDLMRKGEAAWQPAEAAEAAALQGAWDWIKAVRAASNAIEAAPLGDLTLDARWPT